MKNYLFLPLLMLPFLLACSGHSFNLPGQSASFQQTPTYNNKVDLLFLSDDSSAMLPYRQQMGTQAQAIINRLNAMGMDYHIAVTTTSVGAGYKGGTFIGNTYLTKATPNVATALANNLAFNVPGSDLEQGLTSLQLSLSASNLQNSGGGFLRSDALLAVLIMSSDDDYSSGTVASVVSFFNTLKKPFANGAPSWVANYVGSLTLHSTCSNFVNVGSRYVQLAQANSGIVESICNTDWSVTMSDVQVMISQLMTNYYLSSQPNPATIVVTVNGSTVTNNSLNGWTLQSSGTGTATQYYIEFHGSAIPTLYSSVKVSFTPASAN